MQSDRVVLPSVCMKWFHGKSAVGRLITDEPTDPVAMNASSSLSPSLYLYSMNYEEATLAIELSHCGSASEVLVVDAFRYKYRLLLIRFELVIKLKQGTRRPFALGIIGQSAHGIFCARP